MLAEDARARGPLVGFHEQLGINVVNYGTIAKSPTQFPTFTEALAPTLREARIASSKRSWSRAARRRGRILATPVTFRQRNQTAPFYGLQPGYGAQLVRVDLDPTMGAPVC